MVFVTGQMEKERGPKIVYCGSIYFTNCIGKHKYSLIV
jgi:hypothetical protein